MMTPAVTKTVSTGTYDRMYDRTGVKLPFLSPVTEDDSWPVSCRVAHNRYTWVFRYLCFSTHGALQRRLQDHPQTFVTIGYYR